MWTPSALRAATSSAAQGSRHQACGEGGGKGVVQLLVELLCGRLAQVERVYCVAWRLR